MAKTLANLQWVEELLDQGVLKKPMFGGFAFYRNGKMVLALFESSSREVADRTHKGKSYDFEIWNGCLFPTERQHHPALLKQFPHLVPHPVLSKWLYLPLETENFEVIVQGLIDQINRGVPEFGIIPKAKGKVAAPRAKKISNTHLNQAGQSVDNVIDMKRPRMFQEEDAKLRLSKSKKISDLKNFGPVTEKYFLRSGIKTPQQFVKLGWKKTMLKLAEKDPKSLHTIWAYAMIGAIKNQEWNRLSEEDKRDAKVFVAEAKRKLKRKKRPN